MKEQAIVIKATGKIAVLRICKRPECEGCKVCAFKAGQSTVKVKAKNTVGAKAGDTVIVQAEKDNRLLASFIVYILPVLFAAAGAAVGFLALKNQLWAALCCLGGLVLGFAAVFFLDKLAARSRGFGMEVVEICPPKDVTQNDVTKNSDDQEEKTNGNGL